MKHFVNRENTIQLNWTLHSISGQEFALTGHTYKLFFATGNQSAQATGVTHSGNVLSWTFTPNAQWKLGSYTIWLEVYANGTKIITVAYPDAFHLVHEVASDGTTQTGTQTESTTLNLVSSCDFYRFAPVVPVAGEDGYWYVNGEKAVDGSGEYILTSHTLEYDETTRNLIIDRGRVDSEGHSIEQVITALADLDSYYQAAEGSEAGSEAGDGSRWGSYKTAENARNTAAQNAETDRQSAASAAEGSSAGSVAGDGSRWGEFKSAEAERETAIETAIARTNAAAAAAELMVNIHQGPPGDDGEDGTGIEEVEQTETSIANGGTNKVRITLTDGTYYDIQIKNGSSSNGLFPSSSALAAACPSPKVGDYAFVGDGFPADIYVCETAGTWTDSGEDFDGGNVDLTDYATKDELAQLELKVDDLTEELGEINPHITGRVGVDASNTDITPSSLPEYDDQYGIITLTLGTSGYLWVCLENDHFRITSGGVEIPMVYVKESGDLHCYVSAEKINAGTMMFRVESIHPIKSQGERVTITARSYTVTYGDAMPDFGYIADGEIVGTPAITCEAVQGSAAGTYEIVIARGTVEDDNCIYVSGTLTIAKAELTVTADNKQVAVGGAMPSFTLQYSGFVLDEDESDLTTAPTCTTNAEDTNTEGNYNIVPAGGVSGNYSFTYVNGVLTIGDPVILTLTRAGMYDSGSCGGYIDANDGDKYKNSTTYYGIIVDIRKYKGYKMKITKTVSSFRIAVLKAATLTNNAKPTYSTATGFTGLINYSWGTGETEKEYTIPSDAAYLYVYVYNSSYSGTSFAPLIEIKGVPPTAEYKNLPASLFSTNTIIGNDGTVFTGASAPDTVCTDYLDTSVYTRLLVASFIKNTLPEGVAKLSVNLAYYDGNKKFIKRDSYHTVPRNYDMPPSTAYIRVMANQVDSNNTNLSGDTIRFDGDTLQIEGVATS